MEKRGPGMRKVARAISNRFSIIVISLFFIASLSSRSWSDAIENQSYQSSIASCASDPDTGDVLTFSIVSGPSWLTLAPNGALSGTPQPTDQGLNQFVVHVDDGHGGYAEATMDITVRMTAAPASAVVAWDKY
jgi:hypothetical protein